MIALIFLGIEFQSWRTGFTDMELIVKYGSIFRTNTVQIFLIPDHVIKTTFAHFILGVIFGGARRTSFAYLIDFVVVLIFSRIALVVERLLLVQSLNNHK